MHFLRRIAQGINALNEYSGRVLAWLVLILTLLVVYDVGMRYLFRAGSVALQELEWHIFSLIFLLGAAYTYRHDAHVRLEILHDRLGERGRLWAQVLGDALFLLPFCVLIIYSSIPFVLSSYQMQEISPDPGGLGHRYLIKAMIPLGFALLALQGIANLIENIGRLRTAKGRSG